MFWSWGFFGLFFFNLTSSQASCVLWNRNVTQRDKRLMQKGLGQKSWAGGRMGGWCVCVCLEEEGSDGVGFFWGGGGCYENSHKDRLSVIKGLAMLSNATREKKYPKKQKIIKRGPKEDSQFQPGRGIKTCLKWSHGSSEGLDCSQINQDKLMESGAAEWANERQQRTKAQLTQLCYHLYVGSTFFFLTEWNQWQ